MNEIAEAADDPQDTVEETLIKCLFKHHRLRNPTLGSKKTVNRLEPSDIEKSHHSFYVPKNMILAVCGNFSDKEAQTIIEHFQEKENHGSVPKYIGRAEKSKVTEEKVIKRPGINQSYVSFGLRTASAKDPDGPALSLINSILGMGESSRLFMELREKRALTYSFNSAYISGSDYGYFAINCSVETKLLKQTQNIIQSELEKIKNQQTTKAELEKSKNMLLVNVYRAIEASFQLPGIITEQEIYFRNKNSLQTYLNNIGQLNEQDIVEIANKYFKKENYATAILNPKK